MKALLWEVVSLLGLSCKVGVSVRLILRGDCLQGQGRLIRESLWELNVKS